MQDSRAIAAERHARRAHLAQMIAVAAKAFVGQPSLRIRALASVSRDSLAAGLAAQPQSTREGWGGIAGNPLLAPVLS